MAYQTVQSADCCVVVAGDDGGDGITDVGGVPEAVIDGASVFLTYGGDAGWGYYDHDHHWRDAPGRYRAHMEHFHPGGHGLRGYRDEAVARRDGGHPEGVHPGGGVHPGEARTASLAGHSGVVPGAHPGAASDVHPGVASGVHPSVAQGMHPGMAPADILWWRPGRTPALRAADLSILVPRRPDSIPAAAWRLMRRRSRRMPVRVEEAGARGSRGWLHA